MNKHFSYILTVALVFATVFTTCKEVDEFVKVGAQTGTLYAGETGKTVSFVVSTEDIANGSYTVTVATLPQGVSVKGQVTITKNSGILTLEGNGTQKAGEYPLKLTIDGTTSDSFTLTVESYFAGTGNSATPYLISSAADLANLSELINAGNVAFNAAGVNYRLTENITLPTVSAGSSNFTPIGTNASPFRGTFDGNSKTISNLTISKTSQYTGLFGYVNGGKIKNLGLTNVNISGANETGGIAGNLTGSGASVTECYVNGAVSGSSSVGGIAGVVSGNITHCYTICQVSGTSNYVGGIAGSVGAAGAVGNCYATGAISGLNYCGGIAGTNSGSMSLCAALNTTINRSSGAGSLFGRVVGQNLGTLESNNAAYGGMTTNSGVSFADGPGNGMGFDKNTINLAASYSVHFPAPTWTSANNKLPGLFGNTVAMPSHLAL